MTKPRGLRWDWEAERRAEQAIRAALDGRGTDAVLAAMAAARAVDAAWSECGRSELYEIAAAHAARAQNAAEACYGRPR